MREVSPFVVQHNHTCRRLSQRETCFRFGHLWNPRRDTTAPDLSPGNGVASEHGRAGEETEDSSDLLLLHCARECSVCNGCVWYSYVHTLFGKKILLS